LIGSASAEIPVTEILSVAAPEPGALNALEKSGIEPALFIKID